MSKDIRNYFQKREMSPTKEDFPSNKRVRGVHTLERSDSTTADEPSETIDVDVDDDWTNKDKSNCTSSGSDESSMEELEVEDIGPEIEEQTGEIEIDIGIGDVQSEELKDRDYLKKSNETGKQNDDNDFSDEEDVIYEDVHNNKLYDIGNVLLCDYNPPKSTPKLKATHCLNVIKNLSEDEKFKILTSHFTPTSNYPFPKKRNGGCQRSCMNDYLNSNFVYSESKDGVFCLPCALFTDDEQKGQKRSQLNIFVNSESSNWKKFTEQRRDHEKTEYHKLALFKADALKTKFLNPKATIPLLVQKELKERYDLYMKILETVAEIVHLCRKQNIAFRGSNEKVNTENEGNPGNFMALVNLIGKYNPELKQHLEDIRKNEKKTQTTYLSKRTQNEMINVIGILMIQAEIIKEIKEAGFHSVMADEVTSSNEEIMSVCFRFVDKDKNIREEFVDFIGIDRINGEVLAKTILDNYKKNGLDIKENRGQSYDGAANMSSEKVGVQKRIREEAPKAFYTHCCSHRLNLSIVASCKCDIVKNTLAVLKAINLYFFLSPKRANVLEEVVDKKANLHPTKRKVLKGLCKTRWSERDEAYEASYNALPYVVEALEIISGTHDDIESFSETIQKDKYDSESKKEALALLKAVTSFDYIIGVVTLYFIMHPLKGITQKLQGRSMDIIAAHNNIEEVKEEYATTRKDIDKVFKKIFDQSVRIADQLDVSVEKPRVARKMQNRDNHPSDSVEEYFKRSLGIPLVDNLIMELNCRFESVSLDVIKLLYLIPSVCANNDTSNQGHKDDSTDESSEDEDTATFKLEKLVELYEDDLPNPELVEVEYDIWRRKWRKVDENLRPKTLAETFKATDEQIFPNLFILIKIACTLPVTSCECERSFSCLRRLRTYLRASMGMQRLSALALMSIHYTTKIDYKEAAKMFMDLHPRRVMEPSLFFD